MRISTSVFCVALIGLLACEGPMGPQGPPGSDAAVPLVYYKVLDDTLHYQDDLWHSPDTLKVTFPNAGDAIVTFSGLLTMLGSWDDSETSIKLNNGSTELTSLKWIHTTANYSPQFNENLSVVWVGSVTAGLNEYLVQIRNDDPDHTPNYMMIGSKLVVVFFPTTYGGGY